MSPLVGEPPGPVITRLVSLGPITLPTIKGDITETLGDQLETIGAGVVPGERRPRALTLTIPVRGDYLDLDRHEAGLRLRRQVRALIENSPARLQGLYLHWSVDPEQNGWLLVGGADLKDAQGGITFADFELELSDCYRVANTRTHRPARRLIAVDRRLATTPRDILGTVYSTDFAASAATIRHHLGVAVSDPVSGATRAPATTSTIATSEGALAYFDAGVDGDVVDFEQPEGDMHKAIVRIYDTHGTLVEADWEPVYGPDQPVYGTPVLDNALSRAVWNDAFGGLDIQSWSGSSWVTDATIAPSQGGWTTRALRVVEWTTERAVIAIVFRYASERREWFVSLQRGWSGPRVESYATNSAGAPIAADLGVYAQTGDATLERSNGSVAIVSGTSIGTFAGLAPWAQLHGTGAANSVNLAVLQAALNLRGHSIGGRIGVLAEATGYVSLTLGVSAGVASAPAATLGQLNLIEARAVPEVVAR